MMKLSRWKIVVILAMLVFGVLLNLPNALSESQRNALPGFLPKQTLNLGLDLQGGSYLLLEVDTDALKKERLVNLIEDVRKTLSDSSIATSDLGQRGDGVSVQIADASQVSNAYNVLNKAMQTRTRTGAAEFQVSRDADQRVSVTYTTQGLTEMQSGAVDQSIEIVRRRVDALGTKEPTITRQGVNRIVVQAPGESDPERLKNVIGQTAKLTFQMVDQTADPAQTAQGVAPPGSEILPSVDPRFPAPVVVKKRVLVPGEMLVDARQETDPQTNAPVLAFRFNSQGAKRFAEVTKNNIGKPFAIILDGKVLSAPNINSVIPNGQGIITGNFTVQSANELAIQLRGGALPTRLNVEEQRTVGAELGKDAIRAGQISVIIGVVSIVIFIFLAYGFLFGGVAIVSLVMNVLLMFAAMSFTQATLTLPGIAGLVLSLAVAVDASVLIYERIRDEERAGRPPIGAMEHGFSRALVSILDANATNLISALILFQFGAGPVRGFAWTLTIGMFTSLLSAIIVTQVLLGLWVKIARPKKLPI